MTDRDALIRRIARHEFPDPRIVRDADRRGGHRAGPTRPGSPAERPATVVRSERGRPAGTTRS